MRVAVLDIETFASLDNLEYADYRYLKTRGREEISDEDLEKRLALNPYTLSVISAAVAHIEDERIQSATVYYATRSGEDWVEEGPCVISYIPVLCPRLPKDLPEGEQLLLEQLWQELEGAELLVTYNGRNFDLPVLRLRSMIHGLPIPETIANPRSFRFIDAHLDLADFLSCQNPEYRYTLEFVCRKFGIDLRKTTMDGARVHDAFLSGQYLDIARYNVQDTLATAQLYLRIARYFASEPREHVAPEPRESLPTDRQLQYLSDLFDLHNPAASTSFIISWFAHRGVLTKASVSKLIEELEGLKKRETSEWL